MSDTIIAYRIGSEGLPQFVLDDDGDMAIFTNARHAEEYACGNALFQSGQASYQVIEVEI